MGRTLQNILPMHWKEEDLFVVVGGPLKPELAGHLILEVEKEDFWNS